MASTLFRRQLARTSQRLSSAPTTPVLAARRGLSSTAVRRFASPVDDADTAPKTAAGRKVIDTHIAEELQSLSAADLLREHGGRPETQMRHFTGTLPYPYAVRFASLGLFC